MALSAKDINKLRKIIGDAMHQVIKKGYSFGADADKWVTLSNGAAVQLDGEGNIKKGMGGSHKGENIKEAAKKESSAKPTAKPSGTQASTKARIATLEHMYNAMTSKASLKDKSELQAKIKALKAQL